MQRIGDLFPAIIKPEHKPLSRIHERLISMPLQDEETQRSSTSIPSCARPACLTATPAKPCGYGSGKNGMVRLELQAGRLLDPTTEDFVDVGLPFGPKPRLVLYHLNAEALRTQSPTLSSKTASRLS